MFHVCVNCECCIVMHLIHIPNKKMDFTRISEFSSKWYMMAFAAVTFSNCFLRSLSFFFSFFSSGLKRKTIHERKERKGERECVWWEYKIYYRNQSQYNEIHKRNSWSLDVNGTSVLHFYNVTLFSLNCSFPLHLQYLYKVYMNDSNGYDNKKMCRMKLSALLRTPKLHIVDWMNQQNNMSSLKGCCCCCCWKIGGGWVQRNLK